MLIYDDDEGEEEEEEDDNDNNNNNNNNNVFDIQNLIRHINDQYYLQVKVNTNKRVL